MEALSETASIAVSALNGTGGSMVSAAMNGIKRRAMVDSQEVHNSAAGSGLEWLRNFLERRQFRIPCVDVIVRL